MNSEKNEEIEFNPNEETPGVNSEEVAVVASAPLVERSNLFDFMVMPSLSETKTSSAAEDHVEESFELSHDMEVEPHFEEKNDLDKQHFEMEEHLKMLCDAELIEQIRSIPKRISFKIGEVADLVGVKSFVLRFWETEFDLLKPKKASNNQRMYSKKDVEVSFLIKKLLYRDRFSIEGARNVIKQARAQMKAESLKYEEVASAKQKMEMLVKLQQEKIAQLKSKSQEPVPTKTEFFADPLTVHQICESVDQLSARVRGLSALFN